MKKIKEQKADSGSVRKGIANLLVSRRLSSYEKLKQENVRLKQDIYNLVRNADKMEGMATMAKYKIQFDTTDAIMFGNVSDETNTFQGLLGCLSNGG